MTDASISIVGAGNWLLAHDRIGPRVIAAIEGRFGPEVELVSASGLNLLGHLRAQDVLIVVDACIAGREPGAVWTMEPDYDIDVVRETSIHQIGPIEALVVAHHLYPELLPKRVLLVLVETEGIDEPGELRATEQVLQVLDLEVAAWLAGGAPAIHGAASADEREQHGGLS